MSSSPLDGTNGTMASSRPQAINMDRESALQVLVKDVLSGQDYEGDFSLVSNFIKGIFNQDWQALQERLNEPLTEAQVTHVTMRTLGVVCDLMLSLITTMSQQLPQQMPQQQLQQLPNTKRRTFGSSKSVRFASPVNCDIEFLDTFTEEVMYIVTKSYDLIHSLEQEESDAGKILQALTSKVSSFTNPPQTDSSVVESESDFTYDPQEECCTYFDRTFWLCTHKIKASLKRHKRGYSLTVNPQKVTTELSNEKFQRRCREELEEFLLRNYVRLSHDPEAQVCSERVTTVASELLTTVISYAHQLCEPDTDRKLKVSEESLLKKALMLKCDIKAILFSQRELLTESGFKNELMTSVEDAELLSKNKSKLSLFVTLLIDKVYTKYYPQDVSEQEDLNPSNKACSFPEVNKPEGHAQILPSERTCAFVAEAVAFLLKSLPPSPSVPSPNSESVSIRKAMLPPNDAVNRDCAVSTESELEQSELAQLIARLQITLPELFQQNNPETN